MLEYIVIGAAVVLFVGVLVSKISDRFGVPVLLLFLILGMLAGSEGLGGIHFDDPDLAQSVGVVALALILFSGGISTDWKGARPVAKYSWPLATIGVLLTAVILGLFASVLLGLPLREGLLLGSIVSSTDAAAVFAVLRSKGVRLKGSLKPLLELESGSNDPMALLLTVGMIQLITQPDLPLTSLLSMFLLQMILGAIMGYIMGRLIILIINKVNLGYEGLYPVLSLSLALLLFGLTNAIGGSGLLAVYLAGIVLGNGEFIHKRSLERFHDGLAWLMQIVLFATLGLFVFPTRLVPIAGKSLLISFWLMFVARPVSVLAVLAPSKMAWRERLLIAWVGLRGAAPIILATFPLIAGLPEGDLIFHVIFFIVVTSVLLQGTSIPLVAKWLGLAAPLTAQRLYPIEYSPTLGFQGEMGELYVSDSSQAVGEAIAELGLPEDFLVVLLARGDDFLIPYGDLCLQAGDTLLVLSGPDSLEQMQSRWQLQPLSAS